MRQATDSTDGASIPPVKERASSDVSIVSPLAFGKLVLLASTLIFL